MRKKTRLKKTSPRLLLRAQTVGLYTSFIMWLLCYIGLKVVFSWLRHSFRKRLLRVHFALASLFVISRSLSPHDKKITFSRVMDMKMSLRSLVQVIAECSRNDARKILQMTFWLLKFMWKSEHEEGSWCPCLYAVISVKKVKSLIDLLSAWPFFFLPRFPSTSSPCRFAINFMRSNSRIY